MLYSPNKELNMYFHITNIMILISLLALAFKVTALTKCKKH